MTFLNKLWCSSLHFVFIIIASSSQFNSIFADSDVYIIHMDSSSMPKAFSTHHNWYLTTLSSISDTIPHSSNLIYTYANAINGFTARLTPSELDSLEKSPGFVSSVRDAPVTLDTTRSTEFLGLDSSHGIWPASDSGHDVIIGVVDTGVWPESKSFDDAGLGRIPARWKGACESGTQFNSSLCNNKLVGARYFNKGLLAKYPNLTIAMNSARDTDGHGTHTSSTTSGSPVDGASFFGYAPGTARGAAPKARVAMYKAIWDEGSVLSDIIAAIDQAISDGVDVLSISLGIDGIPLYADPIAVAAFAAMEKGIFVATSAGNEGPFLETLHNGTPWVLNVAAGTVDREFHGSVSLGNGVSVTGMSLYPGSSSPAEIPLVLAKFCNDTDSLKRFGNRIVICIDSDDNLNEQVYYASEAKVVGGIFITNTSDLSFYTESSFPAVFINLKQGKKLLNYIKNEPNPKGSLHFRQTALGTKPAPQLASYSSRGPSPSCPFVLKPDIMAPGDQILASWPSNSAVTQVREGQIYSSFNIISGTSMSCPHAAGVAALLKGVHPEWSPAAVRSAMMTTASVRDNTKRPIGDLGFRGRAASPLDMGSGHVDPNRAADPGLIYDAGREDYIDLMCALNFTGKQIQTVVRSNSYSCANASLHLNYPSFIAFFPVYNANHGAIEAKEFRRTVTNVGDRRSVYTAKVTAEGGLNVAVSPNTLEFSEKNEKKGYVVRVEDPRLVKNDSVVYGSLIWVQSNGKHLVRSPIVATNIASDIVTVRGN